MKTWIVTALLLLFVPATASAGTITGKVPRKGKPRTVKVVRMDTAKVVVAKRINRPKYRIKVARGPYMAFSSAGRRRFKSRAVRVGKRGTRKVTARAAAAPPLAIIGVDPNITISGLEGYRAGLPIDTLLVTGLFGVDCTNGGQVTVVETRDREALEREIELTNSKYFDRSKRIVPRWVSPDTVISGHGQVGGDNVTIDLVMRGKVNGSSSITMPISQLVEATDALAADLKGQICDPQEQPPAPPPTDVVAMLGYRGSLSGSATITSLAGVITESWTSTDVRFSRVPSSDTAPGYEITACTLNFSVSGTYGPCTVSARRRCRWPSRAAMPRARSTSRRTTATSRSAIPTTRSTSHTRALTATRSRRPTRR